MATNQPTGNSVAYTVGSAIPANGDAQIQLTAGADIFAAKQALAKPSRYYGDGGTIHSSGELDVETDAKGNVVAVWFRCQMLPFQQHPVDARRAAEMRSVDRLPQLTGVEVLDLES